MVFSRRCGWAEGLPTPEGGAGAQRGRRSEAQPERGGATPRRVGGACDVLPLSLAVGTARAAPGERDARRWPDAGSARFWRGRRAGLAPRIVVEGLVYLWSFMAFGGASVRS